MLPSEYRRRRMRAGVSSPTDSVCVSNSTPGIFAVDKIPEGAFIGLFTGEAISEAEAALRPSSVVNN